MKTCNDIHKEAKTRRLITNLVGLGGGVAGVALYRKVKQRTQRGPTVIGYIATFLYGMGLAASTTAIGTELPFVKEEVQCGINVDGAFQSEDSDAKFVQTSSKAE